MAKPESRVQAKTYPDDWIRNIVEVLNTDRNNDRFESFFYDDCEDEIVDNRVLKVITRRLQQIEIMCNLYIGRLKAGSVPATRTPEDLARDSALEKSYRAINRLLKRYVATPTLSGPCYIAWIQHGTKRRRSTELQQILRIVDLAKAGRISALKQCAKCSKWLFSRFPHQRFCSETCKEQFHATSEADKKRRRDWARKNYWDQKRNHLGRGK